MPTLKQITCTVDVSSPDIPLKEYQTVYGDGYVQTFIAVPSVPTPFSVHLQSKGYIAPGLAMFVYMDGEYQCNRNRHNLRIPDASTTSRQTEVDFRVRQKEEIQASGTFIGSQWKFRELNIVPNIASIGGQFCPPNVEYIGTIEVLVLRCYPMHKATNSGPSRPTHTMNASQSRKVKERIPTPIRSSGNSSDEDASSAEDDTSPALGGLFDGANDDAPVRSGLMCFGADASWDNGGQNWDSGGQNSWQQPANDNQWNETAVANNSPVVNQGQAAIGQWDNQRSNAPSVRRSRTRSNNGSKHSRQSSITEVISHVPNPNNPRGAQPNSQPMTSSPAVVVNVIQPGAAYMPSPVPGSLRSPQNTMLPAPAEKPSANQSSNSGSSQSGSKSNNSRHNEGASVTNANNDWQATTGAAQGWGADPPNSSKVPGAWGGPENNVPGTTDWNNNGGGNNAWSAPNNRAQGSQKAADNNGWNNGRDDSGWSAPQHQAQGNQQATSNGGWNNNGGQNNTNHSSQPQTGWDNVNATGNGNGNESWNDNNSPQQTSGAEQAQQNTWDSGNGAADGDGNGKPAWNDIQPNHGQEWGADNGHNDAGQNLGNGQPFSQSARKKSSLKSKHSHKAPSTAHGFVQSKPAAMASLNPYLATGPSMPVPLQPKPYWSIWKPEPESNANASVQESKVAEGPIYNIPAEIAQRQMMSHQILISKPTNYVHRTSRPMYIDTHDNPYAAFTFHYRSKDALEKMLGVSLAHSEYDEKQRLNSLSKEQLIQEVLRAKTNTASPDSSASSTEVSSVKGSEKTVRQNTNHAAASGVGFGGLLAHRFSHSEAKDISSPIPGTNPDLLWGRRSNQGLGISGGPHASTNDNVAGWLNNSGAGHAGPGKFVGGHTGSPVTSPPMNGLDPNNGVANNSNRGNVQGTWGKGNDNQGQPQLANGAGWSNNGNGGQGQQRSMRGGSNNNGGGQTGQSWNNGGGNGNHQNGGGWNNDNGAPNGGQDGSTWNNNQNGGWKNDIQQGGNGPSSTQW